MSMAYRWAHGQYERLPALAAELVASGVTLLAAAGDPAALAAKAARSANSVMPIVFLMGDDPTRLGLVDSLNRPNGNITGISLISSALGAKRLEILCELVPRATTVALLVNPTNPNAKLHTEEIVEAARTLGRRLIVLPADSESSIDARFAEMTQAGATALVVENDPFFDLQRDRLVAHETRLEIAAAYHIREFAQRGGLMSYGPSLIECYREFGAQTARALKAGPTVTLPVVRPTRFELVINNRTAATRGIGVPASLLTRVDELID
jgi:putative ABC transport system substrate-binding protein